MKDPIPMEKTALNANNNYTKNLSGARIYCWVKICKVSVNFKRGFCQMMTQSIAFCMH